MIFSHNALRKLDLEVPAAAAGTFPWNTSLSYKKLPDE